MNIKYDDKQSLITFRENLTEGMPQFSKNNIVYDCLVSGLMTTTIFITLLLKFTTKSYGRRYVVLLNQMSQNDLWEQNLDWMVNGKDAYDPKSAGGWNKNELQTFYTILINNGYMEN